MRAAGTDTCWLGVVTEGRRARYFFLFSWSRTSPVLAGFGVFLVGLLLRSCLSFGLLKATLIFAPLYRFHLVSGRKACTTGSYHAREVGFGIFVLRYIGAA